MYTVYNMALNDTIKNLSPYHNWIWKTISQQFVSRFFIHFIFLFKFILDYHK